MGTTDGTTPETAAPKYETPSSLPDGRAAEVPLATTTGGEDYHTAGARSKKFQFSHKRGGRRRMCGAGTYPHANSGQGTRSSAMGLEMRSFVVAIIRKGLIFQLFRVNRDINGAYG